MPLPSWRTGTTAQAAHGCKSTALPAGRGALFVTPPGKQPDACRSRCRTSRRAQCSRRLFFLAAVMPRCSSGLGWLLMSGSMSGLRRAGTRGNRAGSEGSSVFWEVFRGRSSADWCFVVRQWLGGASRPDLADLPARYRCEGEGVAQCLRCPACLFASHSGCASTLSINS